jgi:L-ascorbate metabolism protein UlaG (beta-lactamase superfamily)
MGDIGQESLTKGQLKKLSDLDIVFINFVNGYGMTIEGSVKILNQINPKIVIPTHLDKEGFDQLHKIFNRIEYQTVRWAVDRKYLDNLGDDRIVVFLIPKHGSIIEQWEKTLMSN